MGYCCFPSAKAAVNAVSGAAFGVTTSIIQGFLLTSLPKKKVLFPVYWALASTLLWILIGATWASTGIENPLLIGALSGAAYGAVTGAVFVWFMKTESELQLEEEILNN
jgi:hypothetical protein